MSHEKPMSVTHDYVRQLLIDGLMPDSYKDDSALEEDQKKAQDGCRHILQKWNGEYVDEILSILTNNNLRIIHS